METLIAKFNGNLCSLQFYDQGTGKKDGSSSAWPSSLILPEKNIHYIKISPADSESTKFSGFTKLSSIDKDSIERDIEELVFGNGFKCIELDPKTVFDSVGVIVRKITFPSTLEYFESINIQEEEVRKSSGGNGKSLLDELDFTQCKNLSFNGNFLDYWKVKKVNLYGAGCSVSPIPVFGTGSINCLGFLKMLILPERYEVRDSSFFNIDTGVSGLSLSGKSSGTEDFCTIIANTMVVNPSLDCFAVNDGAVFNCCNIDNLYIKSISTLQTNNLKFTLFRNCRIGNLYVTEELVDEFSNTTVRFRSDNTTVDRLYVFRTGLSKPANWLFNFKQALGLSNLITEKFITDVTYDEAVKEIIEES